MTALAQRLAGHFAHYRTLPKWPFLWRISLEGLVVPTLLLLIVDQIYRLPERTDLIHLPVWQLLAWGVLLSPFIETLLLQALPVWIARAAGLGFWGQVVVSLVVFAASHLMVNLSTAIFGGLLSGFYIAFTYVHWRKDSFRTALWMTTATHGLHNLAALLLGLAAGDIALK